MSTSRVACGVLVAVAVAVGCAKKPDAAPATANGPPAPPPGAVAAGPDVAPMPRPKAFVGFRSVAVPKDELAHVVAHLPEPIRKGYRDDEACLADLDGKAFAWEYAGGPVRLWVEFEEKAQATVPARYPETEDWVAKAESGRVVFWVRRGTSEKMNAALRNAKQREGDTRAVELGLTVRSEGIGVNAAVGYLNPLWYGWAGRGFDRDRPFPEVPFHDYHPVPLLVIDTYEKKAGTQTPRRAKLTLKAQRVKSE